MKSSIHNVTRRKLYEFMSILEHFLLELEQYTLYKSQKKFNEVIEHNTFEKNLRDIFEKCCIIVNMFFDKKKVIIQEEFLIHIQDMQKNISSQIDIFEKNIKIIDSTYSISNLYSLLQTQWSENLNTIRDLYQLCDKFHSKLVEILQMENT